MYLNTFYEDNTGIDIYADIVIKYVSALIDYYNLVDQLKSYKTLEKIYLRTHSIKKTCQNNVKTYSYTYPYISNADGSYSRLTNQEYHTKKNKWEQTLTNSLLLNELNYIIINMEKNIPVHIKIPKGQPTLEQIKDATLSQIRLMCRLQAEHANILKEDNSPYKHNCVHEDGTKFLSRAELLIYECTKKCGLQVIYEYKYLNEKYHVLVKPDFYGYRHTKPFIIEFFGMMNVREYCEKALKKISDYEECGFLLGENLIALCSEKNGDINMKTIHTVLKNFSVYGSIPKNLIYID